MEPEEIKKHLNFEEEIDKMYDEQSRKLYSYMEREGEKAFKKEKLPTLLFLKEIFFIKALRLLIYMLMEKNMKYHIIHNNLNLDVLDYYIYKQA